MIFKDRKDAGRQLAKQLGEYGNREDVVVLGIPRGGVTVAFEVAKRLNVQLDIFLSRKLGVPGHEEFAFGAIAANDGRYLDQQVIQEAGISNEQIVRITQEVREVLQQRAALYRGDRPPLQVAGRTVILIDDGIATGASIFAAINALQQMRPTKLVVAVPVAPASTCAWLRTAVDELICLYAPEQFGAVSRFYESFAQVEDEEVVDLLRMAERSSAPMASSVTSAWDASQRELSIHLGSVQLEGILSLPKDTKSIVLFAHGSGSSRHSPRNQYVAEVLRSHGIGTLLFDLLTREEETVDQRTGELRFDIRLLAERLVGATKWVTQHASTKALPIGYFGASTGAAAALVAAAQLPNLVAAVVSRGGRPDLAAEALSKVHAAVLLIVGGRDEKVITLNRQALGELRCPHKQLDIIPGATHLFEEVGTLEQVAAAASGWFAEYLAPDRSNKEIGSARKIRAS